MNFRDKNLYYVGGVVRDEILNKPSFDIDFCYEGNAIEFSQNLNVIKTNPDFGTVRIMTDFGEIDIASTRTEYYPKSGHLPVINKIGCSLKEDLRRRDFTINAMAKNTFTAEIIDYFDGRKDIKDKKIRVLHEKSFIDDPSRIIRALKFSVRFDFELEEETLKLQTEYLNNINYDMSYHRIKKELKETFNLNRDIAYQKFTKYGIYKLLGENQTIPKINTSIEELVTAYQPNNIWLVYIGLYNLENFELTTQEADIINCYNRIKDIHPVTDYEIYKLFHNLPTESILLYAISINEATARRYLDYLAKISPDINGEDLQNLGITQGKIYKEILEYALEEKINKKLSRNQLLDSIKARFL